MGIAVPRPALRKAGARRIKQNLALHASLTKELVAKGYTLDQASREAFQLIKSGARKPGEVL